MQENFSVFFMECCYGIPWKIHRNANIAYLLQLFDTEERLWFIVFGSFDCKRAPHIVDVTKGGKKRKYTHSSLYICCRHIQFKNTLYFSQFFYYGSKTHKASPQKCMDDLMHTLRSIGIAKRYKEIGNIVYLLFLMICHLQFWMLNDQMYEELKIEKSFVEVSFRCLLMAFIIQKSIYKI